jgi:hypothetical protein
MAKKILKGIIKGIRKADKESALDRFCYLKVKVDEMEMEKSALQEEILSWPDRPGKDGVEVDPYGKLSLRTRENWKILKIPALFKKIGKDTFLEICSVTVGKLKKTVGTIGFKKLVSAKIITQDEDSEYLQLKKGPAINGALKNGK